MDLNVRSMDLVEAFNTFKTLDDGSKEYINTEKLVINGIRIKVSIFDILYERKNIVEKDKLGKIIINGKVISLNDFDFELLEREKVIKKFLIDKLEDRQIARPRGVE